MQVRWLLAVVLGFAAMVAAAVLWAAISASTHYTIGYMSIGVAFVVAYVFRYFVGTAGKTAGIVAATFALLGCVLGNYLTALVFIAPDAHATAQDLFLRIPPPNALKIVKDTFQPMDALFYFIAVSAGYRYAMRPLQSRSLSAIPSEPTTR
jgi:hypothetical protein